MHAIEHTYQGLLADVAHSSGYSEIRGSYEGLQWCLYEAPKLEKYILGCTESGEKPDPQRFPVWLQRLALASVVDAKAMRYLRQLLLFCYKAKVPHDDETKRKAYQGFLDTNDAVGSFGNSLARVSPHLLDSVRRHCQSVLYRFREGKIYPSHGPGAVTTRKSRWQHLYSTIEQVYPFSDWFSLYYNESHAEQYDSLAHKNIIQAKLIDVPKDTRGPRLICVHPAESVWIQQGVRRELERIISLNRSCSGPWPKGHVSFKKQSVNGTIALLSSKSRKYATIDMKEASDRISDVLVQILFGRKYKFFGCCRAQEFRIPNYDGNSDLVGNMNCYAPMGNATTFPVQSIIFWAICVASLQRHGFHQPGAVFVFGDDIIIPTECVEFVIDDLESFGLLVNRTKSFWRGAFRESCGVDAFNGVNVAPVRWKTTIDADHPEGLQSLSDIAMRLRIGGYEEAATVAYAILRKRMQRNYGKQLFLTNNRDHGGIAEFSNTESLVWRDAYWRRDTQWFCSPVWRFESSATCTSSDWNHVLESLCSLERRGCGTPTRPEHASRRVWLNRGWIWVA